MTSPRSLISATVDFDKEGFQTGVLMLPFAQHLRLWAYSRSDRRPETRRRSNGPDDRR